MNYLSTGCPRLPPHLPAIATTPNLPAWVAGSDRRSAVRQRFEEGEEGVEVPFEILHVPEIDSLIAIPVKNRCYIDLDRVQSQEHWVVSGEYFPFEIQVRDLTFVVSSAGEIILQVKHFPESLIREVMGTLRNVAQTLYTDGKPHFRATVGEPDESNLFRLEGEGE